MLMNVSAKDSRIKNFLPKEYKKAFDMQKTLLSIGSTGITRYLRFAKYKMVPFTLSTLCNNTAIVAIFRSSDSHVAMFLHVYVHDVYKMFEICKVYRGEFVPMGDASTWDRYEGAKVIANWTLRSATKGRPKSTH
ncbi:hypothetical protein Ahy_A06g027335 [Arachis hypogaea]|uniref:Uncharacterized protein n=1 Tax=Arachis hypogaea TaxID=3818 RepID=A0A445CNA5_ARAHY|nr:hypothetical protein Ahy_A06g027335 [Arachis hypogaea]